MTTVLLLHECAHVSPQPPFVDYINQSTVLGSRRIWVVIAKVLSELEKVDHRLRAYNALWRLQLFKLCRGEWLSDGKAAPTGKLMVERCGVHSDMPTDSLFTTPSQSIPEAQFP